MGASRNWGWSGRDRCLRVLIVGWMKSLSEAGAEPAVVDGAAHLEQNIGAAPGSSSGAPAALHREQWRGRETDAAHDDRRRRSRHGTPCGRACRPARILEADRIQRPGYG